MKKSFIIFFIVLFFLSLAVEAKKPSNHQKRKPAVSAKSWVVADDNGRIIKSKKLTKVGGYAIITAGLPFGKSKMTNMVRLYQLGKN